MTNQKLNDTVLEALCEIVSRCNASYVMVSMVAGSFEPRLSWFLTSPGGPADGVGGGLDFCITRLNEKRVAIAADKARQEDLMARHTQALQELAW